MAAMDHENMIIFLYVGWEGSAHDGMVFVDPTTRETTNQRHSSLRNIIEYTFGILKKRYPYLRSAIPPYRIPRQCNIVVAIFTIYNFIQ